MLLSNIQYFLYFQNNLETARRQCVARLSLKELTWDKNLNDRELITFINKLSYITDSTPESLKNLHLRISHSPHVSVLPNGAISVPLNAS